MVFKEQTFHGLAPEMEAEIANRASLEAAVANALAIAGGIDASDVEVTMEKDQIVLSGTVGTVGEIERATAVAKAVEGVQSVQNRILLGGFSLDGTH
ncbi:BON domain-containing protein [Rhizobium phaseoli]|uniref:BON domain-containing protein n=1 Tax=Rhizobium phaseoli TaxID=396 RepID=UPI0007E93EF9|nr:BON domain-containing protein [Rhizobium phaseoli]ANL36054.1 BON domain-containing protein [Rhizobium phaseoli]ANL99778.1 BON domain-containing protein [Rhizobium phaseoli]